MRLRSLREDRAAFLPRLGAQAGGASGSRASVFCEGFQAGALKPLPRGVHSFLICVRADLHAVILVRPRRNNECRKFLFLQLLREIELISFFGYRSDL